MPWKSETVMDQRVEFVVRAKARDDSMSKLCREFGISRPTGYLWLKRYEQSGSVVGLSELSRRPHQSPAKTEDELEKKVVEMRGEKGWGARKIQVLLARQGHDLASATIHRILIRRGMIKPDTADRQATKRFERSECNQMAQMDFKGEYQVREGKSYPLSFLDDHSRYLIGLWPLESTNTQGVQESLRSRFREIGVPESILTDHGSPWFSTTNGHGLTRLSVWLIKQGITLKFSGIRHPQTHGKVERFHRTLKARTKHRGLPETLDEWRRWASEFINEYNYERPHEAIGMKAPGEVYTHDNLRPYQENPSEWEYAGGTVKKLNTQGALNYCGQRYFVCEALAGEWVRLDELEHTLVVTFRHTTVREINLETGSSIPVVLEARKKLQVELIDVPV
jgi:transposase InsO family protein